jgi:hypothetical protein
MLAIKMPENLDIPGRAFLIGWSQCMQAMMHMDEKDKKLIEKLFREILLPEAHCKEAKALDEAFLVYLLHKCDSPERVGAAVPEAKG